MAGNDAEYGGYSDKDLDKIAKHAAQGFLADLDGKRGEADAHYRRAKMVADTAKIAKRK